MELALCAAIASIPGVYMLGRRSRDRVAETWAKRGGFKALNDATSHFSTLVLTGFDPKKDQKGDYEGCFIIFYAIFICFSLVFISFHWFSLFFKLSAARSDLDTVLLIGSSGFVGARVAELLTNERCFNVVCLDRSPPRALRRSP